MTNDDWEDDDSWDDDDGDIDDEDGIRCPECGGEVPAITDLCPACGYWITESDRRTIDPGMAKPIWLRMTAAILLAAFLFTLLAIGFALF